MASGIRGEFGSGRSGSERVGVRRSQESVEEFGLPDRFGQPAADPERLGPPFLGGSARGEHQHRHGAERAIGANPAGQVVAIHPGHHPIEQDHVEGESLFFRVIQSPEGLDPTGDGDRSAAPLAEDFFEDEPIRPVIVDDQDPQAIQDHGVSRFSDAIL